MKQKVQERRYLGTKAEFTIRIQFLFECLRKSLHLRTTPNLRIMYRSIEDFLTTRKEEESSTVKIFSNLTEETKSVKIHENVRSLERLAWHMTQTLTEMGKNAGLFETDLLHELPIPASLPELIETYINYNTLLMRTVRLKWTDSNLDDLVNMYGEEWKKGKILSILIAHESHHRSQMSVIMRMLGLPVPGIYGPSKEEWIAFGMPPME